MGAIKGLLKIFGIGFVIMFLIIFIITIVTKNKQPEEIGENYTQLYNQCLTEKSSMENNKNTLINQWTDSYNNKNTQLKECKNQTVQIITTKERWNTTYVYGLIKQIRHLEEVANECVFYNESEREEDLEDALKVCNDKLEEIEDLVG